MRWRWRILVGMTATGALAALGVVLIAPPLLRGRLVQAAQQAGYPRASVGEVRLGPWSATIHDVVLVPDGGLSVQTMDVAWTWAGLGHGRVADLRITGLRALVPAGPTGPDPRALLPVSSATASSAWPTSLPLGHLSLVGTVRVAGLDLPLDVQANDLGSGSGWLHVQAGSATTGQMALRGTVGPRGADLVVQVQALPLAPWIAAMTPANAPAALATVAGKLDVNAGLRWAGAELTTQGTVTASGLTARGDEVGGWTLDAEQLAVDGKLAWSAAAPLRSDGLLTVAGLSVDLRGYQLSIHDLTGSLPVAFGRDPGLRGRLRGDLRARDVVLPGVQLEAAVVDGQASGNVEAVLAGVLPLRASTVVALDRPLTKLHMQVSIPRTEVTDAQAVARLVPALAPWLISGAVAMDGTLTWADGRLVPDLRGDLTEAQISQPDLDLHLDGLRAEVRIISLDPLVTRPDQVVEIRRLRWKDQVAEHLEAAVTVTPGHLTAQACALGWAGGTVTIPRLEVALPSGQIASSASGAVTVRGVDLNQVLALAAPGRAVGAGRLSGEMPLHVTWPPMAVTLGEGRLHADPPEGWVRILDRSAIAATIGTGGVTDAALRVRVVDAVQEFAFNHFELTTSRVNGELLTRAEVAGRGRNGQDPLEIGSLVFRIHGLEDGLAQALRLSAGTPPPSPPPTDDLDRFFDP